MALLGPAICILRGAVAATVSKQVSCAWQTLINVQLIIDSYAPSFGFIKTGRKKLLVFMLVCETTGLRSWWLCDVPRGRPAVGRLAPPARKAVAWERKC